MTGHHVLVIEQVLDGDEKRGAFPDAVFRRSVPDEP
jgi:hypothetical protein